MQMELGLFSNERVNAPVGHQGGTRGEGLIWDENGNLVNDVAVNPTTGNTDYGFVGIADKISQSQSAPTFVIVRVHVGADCYESHAKYNDIAGFLKNVAGSDVRCVFGLKNGMPQKPKSRNAEIQKILDHFSDWQ